MAYYIPIQSLIVGAPCSLPPSPQMYGAGAVVYDASLCLILKKYEVTLQYSALPLRSQPLQFIQFGKETLLPHCLSLCCDC